jgi:hypothetical protein
MHGLSPVTAAAALANGQQVLSCLLAVCKIKLFQLHPCAAALMAVLH